MNILCLNQPGSAFVPFRPSIFQVTRLTFDPAVLRVYCVPVGPSTFHPLWPLFAWMCFSASRSDTHSDQSLARDGDASHRVFSPRRIFVQIGAPGPAYTMSDGHSGKLVHSFIGCALGLSDCDACLPPEDINLSHARHTR